ncbi:MAG: glycosyltransferase family 4 protein [Verrucomicrobiota bacterium]
MANSLRTDTVEVPGGGAGGTAGISTPALRVLIWSDSDQFAGTERHCCELELGLRKLGVAVEVGCPDRSPIGLVVRANGGVVFPLNSKGVSTVGAVWTVVGMLRDRRVDVIHSHNGNAAILGALSVWMAGRGALVVTQHFITPARMARRGVLKFLATVVHRWVASRVNGWIAVSGAVAVAMEARGDALKAAVQVIWNGLSGVQSDPVGVRDAQRSTLVKSGALRLVCVARLGVEKGHRTLLYALALLKAEGLDFSVWLVGEGDLRPALERLCKALGLTSDVHFVGHQANPGDWVAASEVLVLASPEEPFGLVLLEAMSLGKPVVAARGGGPSEIVADGQSGLLFERDDPRDLALKLRALMDRESLREMMGKAGFARWKRLFSPERMSVETSEVYHRALVKG